jgi:hypothetical protein
MPEKKIAQNYNCMYILADSHANKQYKYYTKYQNIKNKVKLLTKKVDGSNRLHTILLY